MKIRFTLISLFFLFNLFILQAWADPLPVVMFSSTRTVITTINNGSDGVLPLNNAGSTLLEPFGGSKYMINFHAECSVKANDDNTALRIAIVVDPGEPDQQVISPTGLTTNELCTS